MDLLLIEMGSGGEMQVRNNDVVTVAGLENQPYLAMCGGNGWWGNGLLVQGDAQFLSRTENALKANPLTSAGLIEIEQAVNDDLEYLKNIPGTAVSADLRIVSPNRLDIVITINGQTFYFNWTPDDAFLNYSLTE